MDVTDKKMIIDESEESEEENGDWEDWRDDDGEDEDELELGFLCLFCDSNYNSCNGLFEHCRLSHKFDFHGIRKASSLDFYGSFKLLNYVRSQVVENRCWICGITCQSNEELRSHLHEAENFEEIKLLLADDRYLIPFRPDDALLYSFNEDEEGEEDYPVTVDKEELIKDLVNIEGVNVASENTGENSSSSSVHYLQNELNEFCSASIGHLELGNTMKMVTVNGIGSVGHGGPSDGKPRNMHSKVSLLNHVSQDVKKVNESYFGSYSSFCIHREMISDKVRTDSYRQAIVKNPSLFTGAVVMDVGCGTGILSLFAAQAGASRVIAVEASEKMAAVATQIAKDNGLWRVDGQTVGNKQSIGVIEVVQGMVEELEKSITIEPHTVDVLLSEWMGYCLLYESMLSSVLHARDKWLKPGGAILPDTATMYAVGFGRGGTSIPFWEDVYGFNMSCVGKELVHEAALFPIVDVIHDKDLVTNSAALHTFDLATMKPDEVDFTASINLEPKLGSTESNSTGLTSETMWCYGVVLWFDTGFTARFCRETPTVLTTSPYTQKTHWSQTIFTFREPIAIARGKLLTDNSAAVGTYECPAASIHLRISIARAAQHRSIDISLETTGVSLDGRKHHRPVQMFNLS
ncbi:hypothetical protein K2173_024348 [Erythroxylum novogranatense]|uniref:C2H2-type domain-containing protein n=1 Tax=Erythroxylum novogranatense TaxID=1862640 RepID=A0AAV8SUA7_9ROSI|nr:hypothetical protein K2173_024348 [Erythroxylum novogranatense]